MANINYNERSWAIDVISEINRWASSRSLLLKRAGGENTIKSGENSLFPDVLLFGDRDLGLILQGWELKMPDTPLTDGEFIRNARHKADSLGVKSFLLWNVTGAQLYKIDDKGNNSIIYSWNNLSHIRRREEVQAARTEWISMLEVILDDLVTFFNNNTISTSTIIDSLTGKGITDTILGYSNSVSDYIREKSRVDGNFNDRVILWWRSSGKEYIGEKSPWKTLASLILISWVNKLIFAHALKRFHAVAGLVDNITDEISINKAIEILEAISDKCDFWNIFRGQLGEEYMPEEAWESIVSINQLLIDMRIENYDQGIIQDILQYTVARARRKIAGQFTTPKELAAFLAALTITDKTKDIIDPCCGTGTIARASYDLKINAGISHIDSIKKVWASDKFRFPLQMATLAITSPENMGELIRIFNEDAVDLVPNYQVKLFDPNNGKEVIERLPQMGAILSNFPFVQQEDLDILNPNIKQIINTRISSIADDNLSLDPRSDLFAYLPFSLWRLLDKNGRMGIIISNSWLSTQWGDEFFSLLNRFFVVDIIVTSGSGRWFSNADVVTNILVLNKRAEEDIRIYKLKDDEETSFITLNKTIDAIAVNNGEVDYNKLGEIIAQIRLSESVFTEDYTKTLYTHDEIAKLSGLGLSRNAFFSNCKWILEIEDKLIKASTNFSIARGERRGWDKLFYPEEGHGIEADYIMPVIKTTKDITGYIAYPEAESFCCIEDIDDLESLGHTGALNWIRQFENEVNGTGDPLPQVLKRPNTYWYTMLPNTMADIIISINPGERLFFSRLRDRAFVNQRLTRFTSRNENVDIKLSSALLNSLLGLFYIEALGFGRGLGALDLSATKMKEHLYMLNPNLLTQERIDKILIKYTALENRSVLKLEDELKSKDRIDFDNVVLEAFGILEHKDSIKRALLTLYRIRKSVGK